MSSVGCWAQRQGAQGGGGVGVGAGPGRVTWVHSQGEAQKTPSPSLLAHLAGWANRMSFLPLPKRKACLGEALGTAIGNQGAPTAGQGLSFLKAMLPARGSRAQ